MLLKSGLRSLISNHLSFHSATEVRASEFMSNHLSFHSATEVRALESYVKSSIFSQCYWSQGFGVLCQIIYLFTVLLKSGLRSVMSNHLSFQHFINECAKKLCCNECYSLSTRNSFKAYYISLDKTLSSYEYVKQVICDFNGDGETFFPLFYKCISGEEIVFPRLSRRCSLLR